MFIPWVVYTWNLVLLLNIGILGYVVRSLDLTASYTGNLQFDSFDLAAAVVTRASLSLKRIKNYFSYFFQSAAVAIQLLSSAILLYTSSTYHVPRSTPRCSVPGSSNFWL
jgi:hypothetical protein